MHITEARAIHLRAVLETPYRTTFQTMTHRQAVFVFLTDDSGITGIGETYINFPTWAAAGRLAAYRTAFFPVLVNTGIDDPGDFTRYLWRRYYRASLQGNCLGPTMQALSAISAALWDIEAKRAGLPLARFFTKTPSHRVAVYASGINPPIPATAIRQGLDMGMRVFKLKLGFGDDQDTANIRELQRMLGSNARVAVDVNRSWSFIDAESWLPRLRDMNIAWLEEPLSPADEHRYPELVDRAEIPVSAGENFLIPPGSDFTTEGESGLSFNGTNLDVDIVQPAIVKNCCFDDAVRFIRYAEKRGRLIYPHFLGSAPGTAASAHLAAIAGVSHLEWDINPNPLRTACFNEPFRAQDGYLTIPTEPGLGWTLDDKALERWTVNSVTVTP